MKHITKIKLENFKRFRVFSVPLYDDLNVIVGENESGKSTILSAINYVLGGNKNKIETIGFDKLINTQAFARVCQRANIQDLRFYDLRHEATSRLFEKGFNMMEVASITGHKELSMLKRYTHLRAKDLAKRLG